MKVSVIIPTYNRRKLVERAVKSVLAQTHRELEVVVVDDGSTDDTHVFFEGEMRDPRVRYVRLPENRGVHMARNKGIAVAEGDFLVLLDSDDELLPDAVAGGIACIRKDSEIDFVSGSFRTDTGLRTGFNIHHGQYLVLRDFLCGRKDHCEHKNGFVMVRARIAKECRFPAPNMDFIFYRYVLRKCKKIFYVSEICGVYHTETDGLTMTMVRRVPNIARSILRAQALEQFVFDFRGEIEEGCPHILSYYTYGASVGLLLAGEYRRARVMAKLSLRYQKSSRYFLVLLGTCVPFSHMVLKGLFYSKRFILYARQYTKDRFLYT